MSILKKYKHFINESVNNSTEVKSIPDVPAEVFDITMKIVHGIFDKIKKANFNFTPSDGLTYSFIVTPEDYRFINPSEKLSLDTSETSMKKLNYEVELTLIDDKSETFEVTYSIIFKHTSNFQKMNNTDIQDEDEDEIDKKYPNDEDDFDEDLLDKKIKKGKVKLDDFKTDFLEDEENDYWHPAF
jgi:hypothetical protein